MLLVQTGNSHGKVAHPDVGGHVVALHGNDRAVAGQLAEIDRNARDGALVVLLGIEKIKAVQFTDSHNAVLDADRNNDLCRTVVCDGEFCVVLHRIHRRECAVGDMRVERQTGVRLVEPDVCADGVLAGLEGFAEVFGRFTLTALLCGNKGLVGLVQRIGLRVHCGLLLGGRRRLCDGECGFQGVHVLLRYPRFGRTDILAIGRNRNLLLCLFHGGDNGFQLVIVDGRRGGLCSSRSVGLRRRFALRRRSGRLARGGLLLGRCGHVAEIDNQCQWNRPVHTEQGRKFHAVVEHIGAGTVVQLDGKLGDTTLTGRLAVSRGVSGVIAHGIRDGRVRTSADTLQSEYRIRKRERECQRTIRVLYDLGIVGHRLGRCLGFVAALTERIVAVCHICGDTGKLGIQLTGQHQVCGNGVGLVCGVRRQCRRSHADCHGARHQQAEQSFLHNVHPSFFLYTHATYGIHRWHRIINLSYLPS